MDLATTRTIVAKTFFNKKQEEEFFLYKTDGEESVKYSRYNSIDFDKFME